MSEIVTDSIVKLRGAPKAAVVGAVCIVAVVGGLGVQVGGRTAPVVLITVCFFALSFLLLIFKKPEINDPLSQHLRWDDDHPSLGGIKGVLDGLFKAENSATLVNSTDVEWRDFASQVWKLRWQGHLQAILHLFDVLPAREKTEFTRVLCEHRDCYPFKLFASEIRQVVRIQLGQNPDQELRRRLEELDAFLKLSDQTAAKP